MLPVPVVSGSVQKGRQLMHQMLGLERLAFPDDQNSPPVGPKRLFRFRVAPNIFFKFFDPVLGSGFWGCSSSTGFVTMPKASMHEDYLFVSGEYQVGAARQVSPMKSKAEPERVRG